MGCGVCGERVHPVVQGVEQCQTCHVLKEVFFGAPSSVELPRDLSVEALEDTVVIDRRWGTPARLGYFVRKMMRVSVLLLIGLAVAFVALSTLFERRTLVLALVAVYAFFMIPGPLFRLLTLIKNRHRVSAHEAGLELSQGPIPWTRSTLIEREQIDRVVCRCLPDPETCSYQVDAILESGEMIPLIDRLETLNQARYLQHQIGRALGS